MKNSLRNLKLWQKKRSELPVSDDRHGDWLDMNALLDQHMPVTASPGKVSWLRSKKLKTFALTFVSFSAAAMVYVVSNVYQLKSKNEKNEIHYGKRLRWQPAGDSLSKKDSTVLMVSILKRDTANLLTASGITLKSDDSINPLNKPIYISPNKNSNNSILAGNIGNGNNTNGEKNSAGKDVSNSANNDILMNSESRAIVPPFSKKSTASSLMAKVDGKNNLVKNNRDKTTTNKDAGSHKTADKDTIDNHIKYNRASGTNTRDANTIKSGTGKNLAGRNKLYRNAGVLVAAVAVKGNKNLHTAKVRRGNINTQAPGSIAGQNVLSGTAAANVRKHHHDKNSSNNFAASTGQSPGKETTHRIRHRNVKDENDQETDDENGGILENVPLTQASPKANFEAVNAVVKDTDLPSIKPIDIKKQTPGISKNNKKTTDKQKVVKPKNASSGNPIFSKMDWGVLLGVNTSSSFTPTNQNSNFYGSSPVDFFAGVSAAYNFNNKWALNTQIKIFSPQSISYNYTHATRGAIDSPQSLQITSARKIYSLEVPLRLSYSINNYVSIMVGPMISVPIKQASITNKVLTGGLKKDSVYFVHVADTLNGTKYLQKLNFGLSGGINFQHKRLSLGAMWNQSLTGYQISSDFGTFKSTPGTLQFTIGWKLNKEKP